MNNLSFCLSEQKHFVWNKSNSWYSMIYRNHIHSKMHQKEVKRRGKDINDPLKEVCGMLLISW